MRNDGSLEETKNRKEVYREFETLETVEGLYPRRPTPNL